MTFTPGLTSAIDSGNSSTSILTNGTSFTGTSKSTNGYISIRVSISSDKNSASNGLQIQFSDDGSTWTTYYTDTYTSPFLYTKSFKLYKQYYRIVYTNGGTTQGSFSLQSFLLPTDDNQNTITFDDILMDEFCKLKTVEQYTLLDLPLNSRGLTNTDLLLVSSGTASTPSVTNSSLPISVTSGQTYISQSRRYAVYQPGKSIGIKLTGIINNASNTSGCATMLGYYDNNDGLFFGYNYDHTSSGISVNIRNNGSTTTVLKSSWNGDPLDGTGQSGINLDFTKEQLFTIQFAWLGVGIIRFGFIISGKPIICHTVTNYNSLSVPYMQNPNLPVRYEINASSGASGGILQGCASVVSWGGYNPIGRLFSIANTSSVSVTTSETIILAITGNSNYYHQNVIPVSISALNSGTNSIILKLRLYLAGNSPTSGSITWHDIDSNHSVVKYCTNSDITGGSFQTTGSIILYTDFILNKSNTGLNDLTGIFNTMNQLTSNVSNVCDILCLTATTTSGNAGTFTSISWQEIY